MAFNSSNNFNKRPQGKASGAHGIARVISKRGFCSRSQAEKLVREGCVTLNGRLVKDPDAPARESDKITVNGVLVVANEKVYFMMNKPRGVVTTASDEKGRETVMDVFSRQFAKLYPGKPLPHIAPVGRLDAASEGLLLFTNDTEWANRIMEPTQNKSQHIKIYRVQTKGKPSEEDLRKMEEGFNVPPRVFGEPEEFMHARRATLHSEGEKNCWLEIHLDEGKNRQIRRMLAHLGYEVLRLVRIQIDNFKLGDLKPGQICAIQL